MDDDLDVGGDVAWRNRQVGRRLEQFAQRSAVRDLPEMARAAAHAAHRLAQDAHRHAEEAHLRAAAMHRAAADLHDSVADSMQARGNADGATRERARADADRTDAAETEAAAAANPA